MVKEWRLTPQLYERYGKKNLSGFDELLEIALRTPRKIIWRVYIYYEDSIFLSRRSIVQIMETVYEFHVWGNGLHDLRERESHYLANLYLYGFRIRDKEVEANATISRWRWRVRTATILHKLNLSHDLIRYFFEFAPEKAAKGLRSRK